MSAPWWNTNLERIAQRDPALAAHLRTVPGGMFTVQEAKNGLPTARFDGRHIHSAYDPWSEAEVWAQEQRRRWQPGETVVIVGVGLLYHAEALCRCLPPQTSLVLLVPDVRALYDACQARPLTEWITQVTWAWGPPHAIADQVAALPPPLRLCPFPPAARPHAAAYEQIEAALRRHLAAQASGQLHIAVVGPVAGGSLPIAHYTVSALEHLGHRVTWIDQQVHAPSVQAMDQLTDPRMRATVQARLTETLGWWTVARLAEDPPDVVLALAQAPLTLPILERLRRHRFVTAIWFVENARHFTYWQQLATGYEFWFVIQQGTCLEALRQAGAQQVSYLPVAADPLVHRPVTLTPEEVREFGADVAFVGTGYRNRRQLFPRLMQPEWTFKLWGTEWDGADALQPAWQRRGAWLAPDLCVKIFNATAVNVNLHSWTGDGVDPQGDYVNPRTFELAACGAFQVVDKRTLLPDLFTADEVAVFRTADEMVPLIRRFVHEPEARRHMGEAARRRVLADHTYVQRMHTLLAHLGVAQPDRIGALLRGDRQAGRLAQHALCPPALAATLRTVPPMQRVEIKDLAAQIRRKGPLARLSRDELLVLLLDEYRQDTKDLVV
ncbi:CgeB family protein [Nitrospira sp. Kam-Ns4a]